MWEDFENDKKVSEAFEKYVDPLFLIQQGLFFDIKNNRHGINLDENFNTYRGELLLSAAICKKTAEKINKLSPFEVNKKSYNKAMLKLASEDIDYIEFHKKKKQLDENLFRSAKLDYCLNGLFYGVDLNNDLYLAGILLTIYDKITKNLRGKNPYVTCPHVTRSNLFKYVKEALLEVYSIDIVKMFANKNMAQLIDFLWEAVLVRMYDLDNSTDEVVLGADLKNYLLHIQVIEEHNDFEDYKKQVEEEVYEELVDKMHIMEDGSYF